MRGNQRQAGLLVLLVAGLAGCATPPPPPPPPKPSSYIALLANPDGTVGQVIVQGAQGEQRIDQAGYGVPLDGSQAAAPVNAQLLQRDFAEAMAARPELPQRFVLYFETGTTQLTAESRAQLPLIMASAARRASVDIGITGHADMVGSNELNEGLALRRAQTVADQLLAQGLKADAITVSSKGKRSPLVAAPDARSEPRNRRVEITVR